MGKPAPIMPSEWVDAVDPTGKTEVAAKYSLQVVDIGLCGIVFIAPFFFGGRHDLGRLVFVLLTAVTATCWFAHQTLICPTKRPKTWAHVVWLLAAGLLLVQILPLPKSVLQVVSPRTNLLLPLWTAKAHETVILGTWQTVSLYPHETTKSLAMLICYGLLFIVVAGRIQERIDIERVLRWIAISATLMATFGIVQYFTSDGRFFWFYSHPSRKATDRLSGAFANANHFAHLLILGVGPLTSWLLSESRRRSKDTVDSRSLRSRSTGWTLLLLIVALTIVLFAALLSLSRGGTLALLTTIAVAAAVYAYGGLISSKYLWSSVGLSVVVLGLLSLYGYDQLSRRLSTLTHGSLETIDHHEGRRKIWRANIAAIKAGGLLGAGAGSQSVLYPVYLDASLPAEYTHAESGYLQVATENGFVGVALLVAGLGCCASWCGTCLRHGRSDTELLCFGAAAAGLAASAVHSIVDFVWYIPACMSVTVVLAACVLRLSQLALASHDQRAARPIPKGLWWGFATASALVGAWATHTYVGPGIAAVHWDRYLRLSASSMSLNQDNWHNLVAGRRQSSTTVKKSLNEAMFRQLESVIRWDPKFARAHLRMAAKLVTEFELRQQNSPNRMGVSQIRDAVMASGFESDADRDAWLRAAFGSDVDLLRRAQVEARAAVSHCPLQGEGYVQLAELGFLDGDNDALLSAYIDQAQHVRPHDADVLYQVGHRELLKGNFAAALECWKRCFNDSGSHQLKIVYILAGQISAEALLTALEPDWRTLPIIWSRYRESAAPAELNALLVYASQQTQRETQEPREIPVANIWRNQAGMLADVGRKREALACLQRAYACDTRQYAIRYELAKALADAGQFAEAEPHFRWCLARHPEDKSLREALVEISKQRIAQRDLKLSSPRHVSRNGEMPLDVREAPSAITR